MVNVERLPPLSQDFPLLLPLSLPTFTLALAPGQVASMVHRHGLDSLLLPLLLVGQAAGHLLFAVLFPLFDADFELVELFVVAFSLLEMAGDEDLELLEVLFHAGPVDLVKVD